MAKGKYVDWLTPDGLLMIEGWARDGLTEEQIANNMGIAVRTLGVWKEAYPPILHALKRGKAPVDIEVENALLKRALGYEYDEVKTVTDKDGNVKEKTVTRKVVLPDTTAQIFWLKNRKPAQWRDKPLVTITGSETETDPLSKAFEELNNVQP